MPIERKKQDLLESNGYFYDLLRRIYINPEDKKVFSFDAISDKPMDWLEEKIYEVNETGEWKFNFNTPPSPEAESELIEYLEQG